LISIAEQLPGAGCGTAVVSRRVPVAGVVNARNHAQGIRSLEQGAHARSGWFCDIFARRLGPVVGMVDGWALDAPQPDRPDQSLPTEAQPLGP
jgi:hypothetical protein